MSKIEDFRNGFKLKHKLVDILTIAVLADVETWDAMERYGKERLPLLKKFLELPAGIPSHDSFNRVFSRLHPKSLETALQEWITSLISTRPPDVIAIDGKSLRGSNTPSAHSFVHMVSAFAGSFGLSLAQMKADEISHEITAIPKWLDRIDIEGCTLSIDAMGCQKEIAPTGGLKTHDIGCWMWLSMRMLVQRGRETQRRTGQDYSVLPETS